MAYGDSAFHAEIPALDAYRSAIGRFSQLKALDEREIGRRFRAGDARAGAQLVEASLPFVIGIAREYRRWGVPMEDLVQQGNVGLLKAAARFDPDAGCRLVTYAAYWIRAEIREYVMRSYRVVRVGTTKGERRAIRAHRRSRDQDAESLAALSGMPVRKVERLLPLIGAREVSLDHAYDDGASPSDRLAAAEPNPEDVAERDERTERARAAVAELMKTLPPREQLILRSRWLQDDPVTLDKLGETLGVSKERVRQIEARILGRLRAMLATLATD